MAKELTPKQKMFCKEYLIDLNATRAAIRAGYSEKTARKIANENLTKPDIQEYIQAQMNKRAAKIEITADKVLQEIAKMAFANVQDLYDEHGILKPISELPRDVAAAVQSVKVNLTEACAVQEVKLWDKKGTLELLGKHLRLFDVKDKEPDGSIAEAARIFAESMARTQASADN